MFAESPGIRALYLRDYFWLQHRPRAGDEKAWRRVECAGLRIAESVGFMRGNYSFETRIKEARRVRRAARECAKLIPGLGADDWTLEAAHYFEGLADAVLAELAEPTGVSRQH